MIGIIYLYLFIGFIFIKQFFARLNLFHVKLTFNQQMYEIRSLSSATSIDIIFGGT